MWDVVFGLTNEPNVDYFEILDIRPPKLSLDSSDLQNRFYKLSMEQHPDLKKDASLDVQQRSAELNKAYRTLRDPWLRAAYIVEQNKLPPSKEIPTDLTAMYFEIQESDDRAALAEFQSVIVNRMKQTSEKLLRVFEQFDSTSAEGRHEVIVSLQRLCNENAYVKSMAAGVEKRLKGAS